MLAKSRNYRRHVVGCTHAHGESGGEISTIGYLEVLDVKAALDYVLRLNPVWNTSVRGAVRWAEQR